MSSRALIPWLAACAIFATAIVLELGPTESDAPAVAAAEPRAQAAPPKRVPPPPLEELVATAVARPLFSTTRRPAEKASPTSTSDPDLSDIRLTGIVMDAGRHVAIFAVAGARPVARSEGENLKEWRLDSISAREVSLSGPGGSRTLAPKIDPNLVRAAPPVLPGAATAGRGPQALAQPVPVAGRPPNAPAQPLPMPAAAHPGPAATLQPRAGVNLPGARPPNLPIQPQSRGVSRPQQ